MSRCSVALGLLLAGCTGSADDPRGYVPETLGRCAHTDPLRRPFFGDTHVHTALSLDANLQGTRLGPADAYRFALGEAVGIQPHGPGGTPLRTVRLERPLDWVALSDHAEFLGTVTVCTDPDRAGYDSETCRLYRESPDTAFIALNLALTAPRGTADPPELCELDGVDCGAAERTAWRAIQEAADQFYDRTDACSFTTFVGYEWSGNPGARNLHRNVLFRNEIVPEEPLGYLETNHVEALWDGLEGECLDQPHCDVLTIPHNSNLSGGLMFEGVDRGGAPYDADYAARRAAMEPLVEIFQHKGSSECLPGSAAADEQCGFEYLPFDSLSGANLDVEGDPLPRDFVRDALGQGLAYDASLGVNPYAYGFVASTDTHLGTPGLVNELDFPGHGGAGQGNRDALPEGLPDLVYFNPGGLAVLWAEENSREALFQAMRRREAYGTSGPRIVLRFFGGRGYAPSLCEDARFAEVGYDQGVPMGGTLPRGEGAPTFALSALRDPGTEAIPGTPLQRLQVVKGWLEGGEVRYAVYDVAGDAAEGAVDPDTCATSGGVDALCTVWTDPDFDPQAPAFWYARVLEAPSCRWHARHCAAAGVDCADPDSVEAAWASCCDERVSWTVQERAWSSPIWHVPGG